MKKNLFIVLITFLSIREYAQNNALAFPSPNNTFLGGAGNPGSADGVDVDLYTGTGQIKIPITSLASNSISIPVSLDYTGARGIRVQDYATCIGLGWQLNAGGAISRVVRCFPDEQPNGYLGNGGQPSGAIGSGGQWGKVVVNEFKNNITWTSNQKTAITGIDNNGSASTPTADGEPDIFYIKTPFFAFQFSFDENGSPVFSNSNGVNIVTTNFLNASNYSNSSFEVIDANGNQYYFGSSSSSVETSTTKLFGTSYTFPTTWYLDRIVTYNSKDVITLSYQSFFNSDILNHFRSVYSQPDYGQGSMDAVPYSTTINQAKFITEISSSLGEIDFSYTTSGRMDDPNAPILSGIILKGMNPANTASPTPLTSYGFNYSYFGLPSNDPDVLRLRLDNITISGNTVTTATPIAFKTFAYNNSVSLPSRALLTAVDYWGYNAAPTSSNMYNLSQPASQTYAVADILTSITDLAGGITQIGYESNAYNNNGQATTVGGLRVTQITRIPLSGTSLTTQYKYVDNNNLSTGQILSDSYAINIYYTGNQNCSNPVTEYFSESFSNFYDLNGNFIGYSSVKVVDPNGGWSIFNFSNFSDFKDNFNYAGASGIPDITSSISLAYKRGLLLDKSVYNSSGTIISEDYSPLSSYASLTSLVQQSSFGYHWYILSASVVGELCNTITCNSFYWTYIENFRPIQTIHKDYDANGTISQTTSNISYVTTSSIPSNNNRLVQSISTTNSKGNSVTKTIYYADASNIPMLTSSEQIAITAMLGSNNTDAIIHQTNSNNGAVSQLHNSYSLSSVTNKVFLDNTASYKNSTLVAQQFYAYDPSSANLLSSNASMGKPTSILYGYNNSYPIAKVVNASSNFSSLTQTTTNYFSSPLLVPTTGTSVTTSFTNSQAGDNIVLTYSQGVSTLVNYTLTGPQNINSTGQFYYAGTVTLPNMPAGQYQLTANFAGGSTDANPYISVGYYLTVSTFTNEFYYEGFEQGNQTTVTGQAHTGNNYFNGTFSVPFVLPNNRHYVMQWWVWQNSKWNFNEQPYTGPATLSGSIDDIRIFPIDAQITSYTYSPMVGKTGEIDPGGRTVTYGYDGFGRQDVVRDNDFNILSKSCYTYAGQTINCTADNNPAAPPNPPPAFTLNVVDNNSTYTGYTIQLSGNGPVQTFTVANHGANSIGPITPGAYNILITPPPSDANGLFSIISGSGSNSISSSGSTASFSYVMLGSSNYNTINIY